MEKFYFRRDMEKNQNKILFLVTGTTENGEYSMEKIKMSYDKLDFSRPAENLKPHYHSSSTLRSSKSKEFSKPTTASSALC